MEKRMHKLTKLEKIFAKASKELPFNTWMAIGLREPYDFEHDENRSRAIEKLENKGYNKDELTTLYNHPPGTIHACSAA